jgi:hypothetical protein
MTTIAISGLPVAASQAGADVLPIVQAATSTTKQLSVINLFTNSALVTPILGTPQSGTLTNCTGLPVATGISGLGASVAAFLATPSSANLATAVTGETGTGALVFATSPTLVTPTIGLIANTAVAGTIASAATVAPTAPVTIISGTAAIVTITAPAPISATGGTITFIPTGAFTWTTAGNIAVAGTAVVSRALTLTFDATTTKWYPSYV